MKISFWKVMTIFGIVSNWSVQALADKKVTLDEAKELVEQLCHVLGVKTEYEIK
ncbi:hypothetical protein ES702_06502 [subsurface metagenome]